MVDLNALTATNSELWGSMEIVPSRRDSVMHVAQGIRINKYRYVRFTSNFGLVVPWWFVGLVHYRECGFNWAASIAQGDAWSKISVHVPRGRGPFKSWEDAAFDALTKCPPFTARWKDWSNGGRLTAAEAYNGFAYEQYHHEFSPYNWGATNHEQRGKYVTDGHYDPAVWDTQIGCAAILKGLEEYGEDLAFPVAEKTQEVEAA
jgi:lysozyme family protein